MNKATLDTILIVGVIGVAGLAVYEFVLKPKPTVAATAPATTTAANTTASSAGQLASGLIGLFS